jgi:hypothetical protein
LENRFLVDLSFPIGLHWWLFGVLLLVVMRVALEIGFRMGRRSRARNEADTKPWIAAVEGALFGVLALLLGFTVSMAVSRFDTRRVLLLQEANAIGTVYWRTQLVPAPEGSEMVGLLREYVDARLQFDRSSSAQDFRIARDRADKLQHELWSRGVAFAAKDPRSVTAGMLLESLNQTFDLETARWAAFNAHVPETVIMVDAVAALLAIALVGYSFGLGGHRNPFTEWWITVCLTLVLMVIMDLDHPLRGLIHVSRQPMIDLQRQMGAPQR